MLGRRNRGIKRSIVCAVATLCALSAPSMLSPIVGVPGASTAFAASENGQAAPSPKASRDRNAAKQKKKTTKPNTDAPATSKDAASKDAASKKEAKPKAEQAGKQAAQPDKGAAKIARFESARCRGENAEASRSRHVSASLRVDCDTECLVGAVAAKVG